MCNDWQDSKLDVVLQQQQVAARAQEAQWGQQQALMQRIMDKLGEFDGVDADAIADATRLDERHIEF
jgi:hypothetical protein